MNQTRELAKILRRSNARQMIFLFAVAITLVISANAVVQIRLNSWQGTIYDAISQREVPVFLHELGVFAVIVSILLCLGVAQTWLHEMLKIRLRETVTHDLLDEWLKPLRAYRLPLGGDVGANPDQRMQDDARRLTELSTDLGVGLVQSSLMLLAFIGVLWQLSAQVVFVVGGETFMIPGYMVWCAIVYAIVGSFFTWLVGSPLIQAHGELRAAEANFRFDLMRVSESAEAIAVYGGEAGERRLLDAPVATVIAIMRRIARRLAWLTWVTGTYGWIGLVAPIILAAPGYFGGTLSLGGLMMVVGAFYQVQQSLRWYVDRFPVIAEWQAMLSRVMGYRNALTAFETLGTDLGRFNVATDASGTLAMEDLCVFGPNGHITLSESPVTVTPGERVLIVGTAKSGKSIVFRAIAGLWVWGTGTLRLPPRDRMMFLPQTPYIPLGSLRGALTYPAAPDRFGDAEIRQALERVQLARLAPLLDRTDRWDKQLTHEEQHRVVLARLLLHKPSWIIQDETMSELDEEIRKTAESIFENELAGAAVVSFGRADARNHFYHRVLRLRTAAPGLHFPLQFCAGPADRPRTGAI